MPPKHLAPSLMASPPPKLQRQILYHSLSHTAKKHRSFTKAERRRQKKKSKSGNCAQVHASINASQLQKIFPTLQSESPRVQYKLTNPCNFLVRQATEYSFLQGTRKWNLAKLTKLRNRHLKAGNIISGAPLYSLCLLFSKWPQPLMLLSVQGFI